ncbi:MAG TPA: hydroxysqualene dehydroxylase HpnE [Caulobacteraceae bacterium]
MTVHIIGAGLAGLSAAVRLAEGGARVSLLEASAQAGGRCRSYVDPVLEMRLDNGNHLVLSGNHDTYAYLRTLGAADRLAGPDEAVLDFHDLSAGEQWRIHANAGPVPWWVLSPRRRVPGTRVTDYVALGRLLAAGDGDRIDQVIACRGALWDRLMEPFLLAALNTPAAEGSAQLAGAVIAESLARGGRAYQPRVAHPTLSAAFIEPALAYLATRGVRVSYGAPVRSLAFEGDRVTGLGLADGDIQVHPGDQVVLAAPAWISAGLVPGLSAPDRFNAIVNGHFKVAPPPGLRPIVGVIGGAAQWIFAFEDRISVTVSAADDLADQDRDALARRFWADIAEVHGLPPEPPPSRIVKERRATFHATPEQNAKRPAASTAWGNLFLAGDWTATGLPATIEGAIRSGVTAARLALSRAAKP